jgi:diguanylate cyclase (GGDEF)-like protein
LGIGFAGPLENASRPSKHYTRARIFAEGQRAAAQHTALFAVLGLPLWGADWEVDAHDASRGLWFRLGIAALLLLSAAAKWLLNCAVSHCLVNYLSLALSQILLVSMLSGMNNMAIMAGSGEMLYFLLGSLILGGIYPSHFNLLGCAILMVVPSLSGALLIPYFPHWLYAAILWPMGILTLYIHRTIRQLHVDKVHLQHELEASVLFDAVTGLLNVRGLEQAFQRMVKLNAFHYLQQYLLFIKIDNLEQIAADHGPHATLALRGQFGQIIDLSFRNRDIAASLNEEFACLLLLVSREKAFDIAERFRAMIAEKEFDCPAIAGGKIKCTISVGIVSAEPGDHIKSLINHARTGINQTSSLGGNLCVCV